jgi:hypothetical protein
MHAAWGETAIQRLWLDLSGKAFARFKESGRFPTNCPPLQDGQCGPLLDGSKWLAIVPTPTRCIRLKCGGQSVPRAASTGTNPIICIVNLQPLALVFRNLLNTNHKIFRCISCLQCAVACKPGI